MRKSKYFDPGKSFFELVPVRVVGGSIILLAAVLFVWIIFYSNNELRINLSYEGLNHIFTAFKLPIAILALLIPFGALFAANHRSEQSRYAAELAESQNRFSNYYKHVDEFTKYLENYQHTKESLIKLKNPRSIHYIIYGGKEECMFIPQFRLSGYAKHLSVIKQYWIDTLRKVVGPNGGSGDAHEMLVNEFNESVDALIGLFKKNLVHKDGFPENIMVSKLFDRENLTSVNVDISPDFIRVSRAIFSAYLLKYAVEFDVHDSEISNALDDFTRELNLDFNL